MSLLMEALRKAEAAKRQVQEEQALMVAGQNPDAPASPFEHSDAGSATRGMTPEEREISQRATEQELHDYLNHPQELDEITHVSRIPTLTAPVTDATPTLDRQAAATVFSAKAVKVKEDTARRTRTAVLAGIALLMVPLWFAARWYLEQQNSSSLAVDPSLANMDLSQRGYLGEELVPAPVQPPNVAPAEPVPLEPTASPDAALTQQENTATQDSSVAASATASAPRAPVPSQSEPVRAVSPAIVGGNLTATDATAQDAPAPALTLEITRSVASETVDPQLQEAYSLFRSGELDRAAQGYQAVAGQSPDNRDALLGLAAIALQQQNPVQARSYYRRLLELNPQDHLARAGLVQSLVSLPPSEKEVALRDMVADAPETAPLHFALGNLYASQQRWQEAQEAYFDALLQARRTAPEPVNPDYAFNLAISLERLGQTRAALEYYKEAQNLARTARGSFDAALLNQRLATLEQLPP